MLAAVIPLPSELVTPPVTKTYFGIGFLLHLAVAGAPAGWVQKGAARERPRHWPLGKQSYPSRAWPVAEIPSNHVRKKSTAATVRRCRIATPQRICGTPLSAEG